MNADILHISIFILQEEYTASISAILIRFSGFEIVDDMCFQCEDLYYVSARRFDYSK